MSIMELDNEKKEENRKLKTLKIGINSLDDVVNVHKRIGSGTFSTVFLASLTPSSKQQKREQRKLFAIKRLIPTSNPKRIEQELKCLMQIGGTDNVGGIYSCVRQKDLVAFVMPYLSHEKFHEYFYKMDAQESKMYMKNLLIALRRVHSFKIIHRDIKPSNFLYNRQKKEWMLVDFGLAQEVREQPAKKREREASEEENNPPKREKLSESQNSSTKFNEKAIIPSLQFKSPLKTNHSNIPPLTTAVKANCLGLSMMRMLDRKPKPTTTKNLCFCHGRNQVCTICFVKPELQASRAGTPGYRPPEVLLKYQHQTTAVDIWAAGIIFLSILARSYPFFRAHDDFVALAEMITIFGDKQFKQLAVSLGRNLKVGRKKPAINIRKLCVLLRNRTGEEIPESSVTPTCKYCEQKVQNCLCASNLAADSAAAFDDDEYDQTAYDLLEKMLELDPRKRITADDALKHPFFED